ncbi:MAG TPA: DUF4384 domain-containing protein [Chroococcales cyanobacterium]
MRSLLLLAISLVIAMPSSLAGPANSKADMSGAKGLFREQLQNPDKQINTGIEYWIELHRGDEVITASNKTDFQSGDKLSFHVTPNINGYAYILYRAPDTGEQTILFPDNNENNKVEAGKEISLPTAGTITFDQTPGVEKLTLLVSRTPLDAKAYLSTQQTIAAGKHAGFSQLIAMADSGSKDLVPDNYKVSYFTAPAVNEDVDAKDKDIIGSSKTGNTKDFFGHGTEKGIFGRPVAAVEFANLLKKSQTRVITSAPAPKRNVAKNTVKIARTEPARKPGHKPAATPSPDHQQIAMIPESSPPARDDEAASSEVHKDIVGSTVISAATMSARPTVTIVSSKPDGVLAAELSLRHL